MRKKAILVFGLLTFLVANSVSASDDRFGFRPNRGDWLEIGGDIRFDFIVPTPLVSNTLAPTNYVDLDRVQLDIRAVISPGIYSAGVIRFMHGVNSTTATVDVDSWYTRFSFGDHWISAGLTDRFIGPGNLDRGSLRTAGGTLASASFFGDEHYNITLGGMFPDLLFGDLSYRLSYGSGLRLTTTRPGDHVSRGIVGNATNTDVFLHDDDHGQNGDEIAAGLGYRLFFGKYSTIDLVGFGVLTRTSVRPPLDHVREVISWVTNAPQYRVGGRVVAVAGDVLGILEYVYAMDGGLIRHVHSAQVSWRFVINADLGMAIEPLLRAEEYHVLTTALHNRPLTWDRAKITGALLFDINRNVSLRTEYDLNAEFTGLGHNQIDNDELRVQLRVRF